MKIVFLDAKTLGKDIDLSSFSDLGGVEIFQTTNSDERIQRVQDVEVIVTNKVIIDSELIQNAPKLKLICIAATGVDNVDGDAAKEAGITVCNVAGYATQSVAEHTFAMLFGLLKQFNYYDTYTKSSYSNSDIFTHLDKPFWEIAGKQFGIIGLGTIGKKVAQIATTFGADVVHYSTSGKNDCDEFERMELDDLLKTSDIVSIHAPLNSNTKNLITFEKLKLMKPHALLLNLGRGGIINEADLAKALDESLLAGAGLDVFESEPIYPQNPLLHIKEPSKLLLTPHIAWASREARQKLIGEVFQNIEAFRDGDVRNRV